MGLGIDWTGLVRVAHARSLARWAFIALLLPLPAAAQDAGYRLGPGDVVRISVFQHPEMLTETRIAESGDLTFPLLGAVPAGGLTVAQAQTRIAEALSRGGHVSNPQVNLLVVQFRSKQVSVLGYVNRPGRFPIEEARITLADMLAMAGGVANGGADEVIVTRTAGGAIEQMTVNLAAMFVDREMKSNLVLQNGDIIYVPRAPVYYIYGEVQRPGAYRLESGMTVMQSLSLAGGPTLRGTDKGLRLTRRNPQGLVQEYEASLNDPVRAGDVLYVRERLF
ncbi:MAG TPA: polysaccharide export protein EpsE [Pelomicrobium sp.]|nr:polysaccharide export protein EpsE [Pelomicrobium sp.]